MEHKGTLTITKPIDYSIKYDLTDKDLVNVAAIVTNLVQDQIDPCQEDCCKDSKFDIEEFSMLLIKTLLNTYSMPDELRNQYEKIILTLKSKVEKYEQEVPKYYVHAYGKTDISSSKTYSPNYKITHSIKPQLYSNTYKDKK